MTTSRAYDAGSVSGLARDGRGRLWRRLLPAPLSPAAGTLPLVQRQLRWGRRQLQDPLALNGYALIANSGVTGGLGLAYWLVMARLYPTDAVGTASAIYAAMNLLAGITAQNFNGALTRFIPQAGSRTRSFINRSYAVSAAASVAVAAVFLLTIRSWGASYGALDRPVTGVVFLGCVGAWAIFTLQDSVLVGLRSAVWVMVENGIFGVVKLVLLVLLVTRLPHHLGIYVSWMVPAVLALPLVNALIYRRLVPEHALRTTTADPPTNRQIGRFLAGDYSGALCLLATGSLIPVIVAARTGARQTAYFYVAWVIVGIVDMIGINMGMSLTVEGAHDVGALAANCRRALGKMAVLLLPCAFLLGLLAPWWLALFGPAYARHGTEVLELLAVATLARAVTELYLGALRAQSRTTLVALVQSGRGVLILVLALALTGGLGTVGAAVAVLAGQGTVALATGVGLWRLVATGRHAGPVRAGEAGA
ncbi:MAG TPA: hypothetical protein VMB72_01035 [Acidimicrobiales bacterium]|nr:hypothetical protein [Acidimicrobiales bacterium]